jgi:hypothetical protein
MKVDTVEGGNKSPRHTKRDVSDPVALLSERDHGSIGEFGRRYPETHGIIRGYIVPFGRKGSAAESKTSKKCPEYLAARRG